MVLKASWQNLLSVGLIWSIIYNQVQQRTLLLWIKTVGGCVNTACWHSRPSFRIHLKRCCFSGSVQHIWHLMGLKDKHGAFREETLNVKITVCLREKLRWVPLSQIASKYGCISRLCFLLVIIRTEAENTFCRGEWQDVFGESAGIGNNNRDNLSTSKPLVGTVFHYCNHQCIMMWSRLVALPKLRLRLRGDFQPVN